MDSLLDRLVPQHGGMGVSAYGFMAGAVVCLLLLVLWRIAVKKRNDLTRKYQPIISIEEEVARQQKELDGFKLATEAAREEYSEKRKILDKLTQQLAVYDERLSFVEMGVYEPHFDFGDSEEYKCKITEVRERQKEMIKSKSATVLNKIWKIGNSEAKGQAMANRQVRLTLRAFNNECEAAIANTRWNNAEAMQRRIRNSAKQIDSANASLDIEISEEYIKLKLEEMQLTHEYRQKLKAEKDERAELSRTEREEKKLRKEAERAEKEESKFQEMLEKARRSAGVDSAKIAELEAALAEKHNEVVRARAMAEFTNTGFVYIVSNIGSFGEDVVKIGLTRRLDPDDRVKELGDASVPFGFDTHAMIYSENAPELEISLHKMFDDRRVNAANMRKEFFRVSLDEVEEAVKTLAPQAQFHKDREAQEWYETLYRRRQALTDMQKEVEDLPRSI